MAEIFITIDDLYRCFGGIEFMSTSKVSTSITIPHPKLKSDGHSLGLTFEKMQLTRDKSIWKLSTNVTIIDKYANQ
jgi:hypothetical protein